MFRHSGVTIMLLYMTSPWLLDLAMVMTSCGVTRSQGACAHPWAVTMPMTSFSHVFMTLCYQLSCMVTASGLQPSPGWCSTGMEEGLHFPTPCHSILVCWSLH